MVNNHANGGRREEEQKNGEGRGGEGRGGIQGELISSSLSAAFLHSQKLLIEEEILSRRFHRCFFFLCCCFCCFGGGRFSSGGFRRRRLPVGVGVLRYFLAGFGSSVKAIEAQISVKINSFGPYIRSGEAFSRVSLGRAADEGTSYGGGNGGRVFFVFESSSSRRPQVLLRFLRHQPLEETPDQGAHPLLSSEADFTGYDVDGDKSKGSEYPCTECEACFRKPAHLRQHMQCHSVERPFVCHVDDCHQSYRRKDHLSRHLIQHEGKVFMCPVDNCGRQFATKGNMQRHVKDLHDDDSSDDGQSQHWHGCSEPECGKAFRYHSRLKKHMESHVKPEYVDVICCEPGCMKHFTNAECLKFHMLACHRYIECAVCGTRQLRKNIKRHMQSHERETQTTPDKIKCPFPRCLHSFSKKSNLVKHISAIHMELRPFVCRFSGCGQKFSYKHVRDNHEKSGCHTYVEGDFLVLDEQLRSKPRGGRKRKTEPVGSLLSKRIAIDPVEIGLVDDVTGRLSRLLD